MKIGDYLDLEKEKSYPCSEGGVVHTVDVDALVEAAKTEGRREVIEEIRQFLKDWYGLEPKKWFEKYGFASQGFPDVRCDFEKWQALQHLEKGE